LRKRCRLENEITDKKEREMVTLMMKRCYA